MNDRQHLQFQIANLRHLLGQAAGDPVMEPQLKERLDDAERELGELIAQEGEFLTPEETPLPRAAVFLSGNGVAGMDGVSPSLAGQVLIQYEKMYEAQAVHDETVAARRRGRKRRPTGATTPELLFTGTPRGSFGLEFVPRNGSGAGDHQVHGESLRKLAETLQKAANLAENESLQDVLEDVPPGVIRPMKQFFRRLASHGAELRLALPSQPSRKIGVERIRTLTERLETEVKQEPLKVSGVFRGVTLETGVFNFTIEADEEVIEGRVSDEMTNEELDHIHRLTNREGEAKLLRTVVTRAGAVPEVKYVLLKGRSASEPEFDEEPEE